MDEVDSANQFDDELVIGFITKQTLQKLKEEVEPREINKEILCKYP